MDIAQRQGGFGMVQFLGLEQNPWLQSAKSLCHLPKRRPWTGDQHISQAQEIHLCPCCHLMHLLLCPLVSFMAWLIDTNMISLVKVGCSQYMLLIFSKYTESNDVTSTTFEPAAVMEADIRQQLFH